MVRQIIRQQFQYYSTHRYILSCYVCTDTYTLFHYYNINNYYFRDFQGNTALHLACLSRKISSAQTLLRMGANPMILNRYGYSALSIRSSHMLVC